MSDSDSGASFASFAEDLLGGLGSGRGNASSKTLAIQPKGRMTSRTKSASLSPPPTMRRRGKPAEELDTLCGPAATETKLASRESEGTVDSDSKPPSIPQLSAMSTMSSISYKVIDDGTDSTRKEVLESSAVRSITLQTDHRTNPGRSRSSRRSSQSLDSRPKSLSPGTSAHKRTATTMTKGHDVFTGLRTLVSKKKTRMQEGGFDLDLTYILDNVIAMGFPSGGIESAFRNRADEVVEFLDAAHAGHYMVYNLCAERAYDPSLFHGNVRQFPFQDHNPPPLSLVDEICTSVAEYLKADLSNTAAIHCKAGKGRTGVIVACLLMFMGVCDSAKAALDMFGHLRTTNAKGVTIPSQVRYVYYYERLLARRRCGMPEIVARDLVAPSMQLLSIRVSSVPKSSFHPLLKCYDMAGTKLFSSRADRSGRRKAPERDPTELELDDCIFSGDVQLVLFHSGLGGDVSLLKVWINTAVEAERLYQKLERAPLAVAEVQGLLMLGKPELDKAVKDRKSKVFDDRFTVTLSLAVVSEGPSGFLGRCRRDAEVSSLSAAWPAAAKESEGEALLARPDHVVPGAGVLEPGLEFVSIARPRVRSSSGHVAPLDSTAAAAISADGLDHTQPSQAGILQAAELSLALREAAFRKAERRLVGALVRDLQQALKDPDGLAAASSVVKDLGTIADTWVDDF